MLTSLVSLVEKIAFGLYILGLGGIVWMANRLRRARRDLAVSQFKLERDIAQVRQANAITFGGLLIEAIIGVWAIANLMAPTMRDIRLGEQQNQMQQEQFVTSTPVQDAPPVSLDTGGPQDEGPAIFETPVPTVTPVGTIVPDAPEIAGCPRDSAWFHIPGNGQLIFEATPVIGTASISNFAFYRFEVRQAVPGAQFAPISRDYTEPIVEGPLGEILPFSFPALGEYRLRLTVFDNTNVMRAACEITIHISNPPPTPTPTIGPESPPSEE